ncbi:MAG: hypothetical protein JWR63_413 [Conexibacter sp.]|nr:hypothetical protein [Conexibacter sp.]
MPITIAMTLHVGELRAQRALGSTAVYRVVDVGADHVQVEVVRAPGLTPGLMFRFSAASVDAMDVVKTTGLLDKDLMTTLARWAA